MTVKYRSRATGLLASIQPINNRFVICIHGETQCRITEASFLTELEAQYCLLKPVAGRDPNWDTVTS